MMNSGLWPFLIHLRWLASWLCAQKGCHELWERVDGLPSLVGRVREAFLKSLQTCVRTVCSCFLNSSSTFFWEVGATIQSPDPLFYHVPDPSPPEPTMFQAHPRQNVPAAFKDHQSTCSQHSSGACRTLCATAFRVFLQSLRALGLPTSLKICSRASNSLHGRSHSSVPASAMASGPFFSRGQILEPLTSLFDPFEGPGLRLEFAPSRYFAEDASAIATTKVDWLETPESHVFKADLPGIKKEDIKVEVEHGNVLKISGTRSHEKVKDTDKWHRVERSHGRFLRRIRLPGNAEVDKVGAAVENGVLSVTIPKKEEKKSDVRSVDIHWSD